MTGRVLQVAVTAPPAWVDEALCAQTDPEAFYPEKGKPTGQAKAVCRRCPVREKCLAAALERGERFGVWGGLSTPERARLNRTQKEAA